MTFTNLKNDTSKAIQSFQNLNIDDQLAVLWFIYTHMGGAITPAAPGAAAPEIAEGLFNQAKELSHQEQLQLQRDLLAGKDTMISREYGSLSANSKLLFWYRLAQGMENGTIIPMPEDYQLPENARELLAALETIDFERQITFLRDVVAPTGSEPKAGAGV